MVAMTGKSHGEARIATSGAEYCTERQNSRTDIGIDDLRIYEFTNWRIA
jgi:hypothetical protein